MYVPSDLLPVYREVGYHDDGDDGDGDDDDDEPSQELPVIPNFIKMVLRFTCVSLNIFFC